MAASMLYRGSGGLMVTQLKLATPRVLGVYGKRGGDEFMMSLTQCFSVGPFDSEAFSFQEVTKNTQGRHICIL